MTYYDVLLCNSVIVGDYNTPTSMAISNMTDALKEFISSRDSGIEKDSLQAYPTIIKNLNKQLIIKYNCK